MSANIAIAGAGPVGLALALMLRRDGHDVTIYEAAAQPDTRPRAVMLHARALEILDEQGLIDKFMAHGLLTNQIAFRREDGLSFSMPFDTLESPWSGILNIRQPEIEAILTEAFFEAGGSIKRHTTVNSFRETSHDVEISLVGPDGTVKTASADWLFGCDGSRSTIRKLLGGAFEGTTLPYQYILGEGVPLQCDLSINASYMLISEAGVVSWLPFSDGTIRIAGPGRGIETNVETLGNDTEVHEDAMSALFEREQATLVSERRHRIQTLHRAGLYRVHSRISSIWGRGRVWLAGDAAHIHPPAGGQALNLGFCDAEAIAMRLNESTTLDFKSYEAERRSIAEATIDEVAMMPLIGGMRLAASDAEIEAIAESLHQKAHRLSQIDTDYSARGADRLGTPGDSNLRLGRRVPRTFPSLDSKVTERGWLAVSQNGKVFWMSSDRHVRSVTPLDAVNLSTAI